MSTSRPPVPTKADFRHFRTIPTRWMDNDVYGHVNNVVYYSYFDTLVNRYLISEGGLDFENGTTVFIAAETSCRFLKSFAYPEDVIGGLAVGHLGRTSVRYEIGLFGADEDAARAIGQFVHVFVDRATMRPIPITDIYRRAFERLMLHTDEST